MHVQLSRAISVVLAMCATVFVGCGGAEKQLAHEMKVFALGYHQIAQGEGQFFADEAGVAKIEWKNRPGPAKLEDMGAAEPGFPELAKRIREGTFVVIWKAKLRGSAAENSMFYLGHELEIEKKGGWVLRADGWPERISAEEFEKLQPIPSE
jgi:hypothetical protein